MVTSPLGSYYTAAAAWRAMMYKADRLPVSRAIMPQAESLEGPNETCYALCGREFGALGQPVYMYDAIGGNIYDDRGTISIYHVFCESIRDICINPLAEGLNLFEKKCYPYMFGLHGGIPRYGTVRDCLCRGGVGRRPPG
jgi:hypothetical protein